MAKRFSILALALSLPLLAWPLAGHAGPPDHAGGPPGHAGQGAGPSGPPGQSGTQRGERDERHGRSEERRESGRFSARERDIIREWLGERREGEQARGDQERPQTPGRSGGQRSLPPGLQMRLERGGDLPPGWQRKVERGEVIDSELIRQARVSQDLRRRLPRQAEDTQIVELEDQVVRVEETTGLVLDVLDILLE